MRIRKDLNNKIVAKTLDVLYNGILLWKDIWEHNYKDKQDSHFFYLIKDYKSFCSFCELFNKCEFCPLHSKNPFWGCKYYATNYKIFINHNIFDFITSPDWLRNFYSHRIYKKHVKLYQKYKKFYGVK